MTTTTVASAYPPAIESLLPQARAIAEDLGGVPSRNKLMKDLKVGAPKATALREALQRNGLPATEAAPDAEPDAEPDPVPSVDAVEPIEVPASEDDASAPSWAVALPLPTGDGHPDTNITTPLPAARRDGRKPIAVGVLLLALPAFVAIWSGWVGLGELTGFGVVHPLPGIWDSARLNTAITLPIGVETYAAFALWVWLSGRAPVQARTFARCSAIGSLIFGAAGQIAYHLHVGRQRYRRAVADHRRRCLSTRRRPRHGRGAGSPAQRR